LPGEGKTGTAIIFAAMRNRLTFPSSSRSREPMDARVEPAHDEAELAPGGSMFHSVSAKKSRISM
jgi:hypothetical protein